MKLPSSITDFKLSYRGTLLAGTLANGIFLRENDSVQWHQSSLTNVQVTSIACSNDSLIYATTALHGVYRSSDEGRSWRGVNGGLGTVRTNQIALRNGLNAALATTAGLYTSVRPVGIPESAHVSSSRPSALLAYPNPTGSYTTVLIGSHTSDATLELFDWRGVVIKSTSVPASAADSRIKLDLASLPPGIYWYRMKGTTAVAAIVVFR